jgi:hypothetical protein
MLKAAPFDGPLESSFIDPVAMHLHRLHPGARRRDPAAVPDRDADSGLRATLIGPFPRFLGSARRITASNRIGGAVRQVGWRALFVSGDGPLAVVDRGLEAGSAGYCCVGGKEEAEAFDSALAVAAREKPEGAAERPCFVRVLEIPSLYVSALWLFGRPALVVPTRLGAPSGIATTALSAEAFIAALRKLQELHIKRPLQPSRRRER